MTYAWFDVTRNAGIARIMHMSYRSKTCTWEDVILVKRSMIGGFTPNFSFTQSFRPHYNPWSRLRPLGTKVVPAGG